MITIIINGAEYDLPTSWDELTLIQFKEISQITYENDIQYLIDTLHTLTEVPKTILEQIPANQSAQIIEGLKFLNTIQIPEDISREFTIGDNTYKLKDFGSLNLMEVINLEQLVKKPTENLPGIIAILYSRNGEQFDSAKHEEIVKELNTMSVAKTYGVYVFFCAILAKLGQNIQRSMEEEKKKKLSWIQRIKEKIASQVYMVRITYSMYYAKAKYGKWRK